MLKKENRLKNLAVKGKSQKFDTPLFNIKIFSREDQEIQFAFVVSKKISLKAVVRNKTKRVLKKTAKNFLNKLKSGNIIIIYAKQSLEFSNQEEILSKLTQVFQKANILI